MPAGTLTLTNNSAVVKGAGTVFNTELKAGDMIVSVVGGVTYTLPVKTVDSATQATLIKAYEGPTQTGAAWYAVPREMQNSITAQLVSEATKAMRGMNYDKQNWQQFFTADDDVTITLPDNSQSTGPSAKKLISSVADKASAGKNSDITSIEGLTKALSIDQGGTGGNTKEDACNNLGVRIIRIGDAILTSIAGKVVNQEGIIGAQQPVGAYNPQNIGGVTWYTHFYIFSLPASFSTAVISCVATLVSPRGDQQAAGTPAFIACTRDKNGGGSSKDAITVSITTPVTGWYPYFNFSVVGF